MLYIKNYIDKSLINGLGLFAAENIEKDRLIWKSSIWTSLIIPIKRVKEMPVPMQEFFKKYGYQGRGKYKHEKDIFLDADNSRFMNHSSKPNLKYDLQNNLYAANHDILMGEELTCDYHDFMDDEDFNEMMKLK